MVTETNSTKHRKQAKPYLGFPLTWHKSGYWAKKIRGRRYYFGPRWGTPEEALGDYEERVFGRGHESNPPARHSFVDLIFHETKTLDYLCNDLLNKKLGKVKVGDLSWRHFEDLRKTCKRLLAHWGPDCNVESLSIDDLTGLLEELRAKDWAPPTLNTEITRIRSVLNHASKAGLIDRRLNVEALERPSQKSMRRHRQKQPDKMFTPAQILAVLESDATSPNMRAMVWLATNCGFGNRDCGELPWSDINFNTGIIDSPRPKNAIHRRAKLWPETLESIQSLPKHTKLPHVFVRSGGRLWYDFKGGDDPISKEFRKLLRKLRIYRPGLSFYALRHTYRTIADEVRDSPAIELTMGHRPEGIAARYRERISDERLAAISDHVHAWLFGGEQ